MKQFFSWSTLMCFFLFSFATLLAQSEPSPKVSKKYGKYRQLFYLPQAQPISGGMYKLDTTIVLETDTHTRLGVSIIGARDGDEFTVLIYTNNASRKTIMHQSFFMNGWKSDTVSMNTWFSNNETKIKKELDDFIYIYFGIRIVSRKEFLKSFG